MTPENEGKWTAVYVRISTDGQRDDSQRTALRCYIRAHGITNVHWYRDVVSGKNMDRPAMGALMADVFNGKVVAILVWRLDRIARNLLDGMNLLADLCKRGVRVVSLCEQLDLSGTVGQIISTVLFGLAQMEREAINERVCAGIAARKARGLPTGRRPGTHPKWSLAKRKVDVVLAKSLRAQGATIAEIAARFTCSKAAVYMALAAEVPARISE